MRRYAMGVLSVLMVACFAAAALAQGNPRGTSTLTLKGKTVSVEVRAARAEGTHHGRVARQVEAGRCLAVRG